MMIPFYRSILILFFILFFQIFFFSGADQSDHCLPCMMTGTAAVFCNVNVMSDLCVGNDVQINGDLSVCGAIIGPTNSNFAFSYLSVQLPFSQPNSWTDVAFDTNGPFNGWSHILGSPSFICDVAGIYCIGYDAVTQSEGSSVPIMVTLGVALNGMVLPESTTETTHININQPQSASRSFLKQLQANDELKVQFYYSPNGRADLIPPMGGSSIALTIFRVG